MPQATARITLPARYRIIRHIANGGMASVWEAHDALLDRAVAIKVLASHLGEDERARRRFAREARTAGGLSSHPHVVTIYDVAEHDGRSFIVMELMRGGNVADRIAAGRVTREEALRWLAEAASALDAAHEAGIVHRDVKPANLLLDQRGRLAIGDFGIARLGLEDQITQTGQVLGTASYIAPEQAMGQPSTPASDRYALAVVAFELLTGTKPFRAEGFAAQARAHVDDPPPPASVRDRSLPAAVDDVLDRGLAKDPHDRWPTAGAMVRALQAALPGGGGRTERTRVMGAPVARSPQAAASAGGRRGGAPVAPAARGGGRRGGAAGDGGPPRPGAPATSPLRRRGPVLLAALVALAVLAGVAAALFAGGGESPRDRAGRDPSPTPTAEATRTAEPTPERTTTPEPTATATATPEPTATATPDDEGEGESSGQGGGESSGQGGGGSSGQGGGGSSGRGRGEPAGDDPTALQLRAFALNNAGDHEQALPYAQKAVRLCEGSAAVSPCAYALFEYAKALRLTGDPQGAIAALEERKQRFPDNQPGAVEAELARARADAG